MAGWGAAFSQCDSNMFGPSPHTMCKFPFVYKGKVHKECIKGPPPSADNKVCQQFFKWLKKADKSYDYSDKSRQFSIYLWDPKINNARVTTCYSSESSEYGWCGTCYNGELQPGQEGYCDKYMSGEIVIFKLTIYHI